MDERNTKETMNALRKQETPVTDVNLVERTRAGDEAAFYALYKRYASHIAGVAYRLLSNSDEVDDVVQDTFVTASQKIGTLKEPQHVRLWLVKIAVRHSQKRIRTKIRTRNIKDMSRFEVSADANMNLASLIDDLRDILRRIPKRYGEPWILHRLEGLTIQEVATACEISVATVKRRVSAADEKVQRKIDIHV